MFKSSLSSGSNGRVGGEKHEIYMAAFGSHLFYDLFLQDLRGPWPPRPPGSATKSQTSILQAIGRVLLDLFSVTIGN